jgi:hypothetical protein
VNEDNRRSFSSHSRHRPSSTVCRCLECKRCRASHPLADKHPSVSSARASSAVPRRRGALCRFTEPPSRIQSSRQVSPLIRPPWSPLRSSFRRSRSPASVWPRGGWNEESSPVRCHRFRRLRSAQGGARPRARRDSDRAEPGEDLKHATVSQRRPAMSTTRRLLRR